MTSPPLPLLLKSPRRGFIWSIAEQLLTAPALGEHNSSDHSAIPMPAQLDLAVRTYLFSVIAQR